MDRIAIPINILANLPIDVSFSSDTGFNDSQSVTASVLVVAPFLAFNLLTGKR
jgi:hypothetical protein